MWPPPKVIASFLTWRGWNPTVIRAGSRLHRVLLRWFGGAALVGGDALLLTTRGWKSGRETSTPLFYAEDGERLLIAASFAGSGSPPVWYRNLVMHPDVRATIDSRTRPYRARTLSAEEAKLAWPKLDAVYPTFRRYRSRSLRTIPVIELSPATVESTEHVAAS
jgi:deazaflavin-dependent oxidoreductase (nitroreductase family)